MNLAHLSGVPVAPLRAVLHWRHCFVPADPRDQDPLRVAAEGGRWSTRPGTLHLADSETAMWCEYLRNSAAQVQRADPTGGLSLGDAADVLALARQPLVEMPPRGVWTVEVNLKRVADLTGVAGRRSLRAAGVHAAALLADDYGPCPSIAALHARLGWQALIARSSALPERKVLAVFAPHIPPREHFRLLRPAAQPTVLHAALTRYRSSERPSWLPARESLSVGPS